MSFEASVKGISAKCSEMTPVVLEGVPHEMRNEPQDSLRATPRRLPVEGKPSECKQEVADNVVTAGRTNGMAGTAKPIIADVDRTATLGKDLATAACGVDEGDEMERNELRLQQTNLFCEKVDQCNGNATEDIPSIHGVPLEGEWTGCTSGEVINSKGVESEGCEGSMIAQACVDKAEMVAKMPAECCQQLGTVDGNPDQGAEPTDIPNESATLVVVSVEPYVEDGDADTRVCLGATRWRACDVEGLGGRADRSRGQTDVSRGQMDTLSVSNRAVTTGLSHNEGAGTYLAARDAKRNVNLTNGVGSHADMPSGDGDVLSVQTRAIKPADATEIVSIPQKKPKLPDIPDRATRGRPDEPNGLGNLADTSSIRTYVHCVGNGTKTAENETESISKRQTEAQTQYSPVTPGIDTANPTYQWKRVSIGNGNGNVPWNTPVEALDQMFAFGEAESRGEAIVPVVEGERAGDSDGNDERGGDGDGTTSGSNVDSNQVNAALLAVESQHMCYGRRTRTENIPVSPMPPIRLAECPYGHVRRRWRRGRIKFEAVNVSVAREREMAYPERTGIAQRSANESKRSYEDVGPWRQRVPIKIEPIKVNPAQDLKKTYLERASAAQSP